MHPSGCLAVGILLLKKFRRSASARPVTREQIMAGGRPQFALIVAYSSQEFTEVPRC